MTVEVKVITNSHKPDLGKTAYFHDSLSSLLNHFKQYSNERRSIFLCDQGTKFVLSLKHLHAEVISSDLKDTKFGQKFYSNAQKAIKELKDTKNLVASPSLTTGVDLQGVYDKVYVLCIGHFWTPADIIQAATRERKWKEMHLYILPDYNAKRPQIVETSNWADKYAFKIQFRDYNEKMYRPAIVCERLKERGVNIEFINSMIYEDPFKRIRDMEEIGELYAPKGSDTRGYWEVYLKDQLVKHLELPSDYKYIKQNYELLQALLGENFHPIMATGDILALKEAVFTSGSNFNTLNLNLQRMSLPKNFQPKSDKFHTILLNHFGIDFDYSWFHDAMGGSKISRLTKGKVETIKSLGVPADCSIGEACSKFDLLFRNVKDMMDSDHLISIETAVSSVLGTKSE